MSQHGPETRRQILRAALKRFANGGYQVSYDTVPEIEESKKGDKVRMCLVSAPQDCPQGDARGKIYRTTNQRTKKSWKLPDSEHACGGA